MRQIKCLFFFHTLYTHIPLFVWLLSLWRLVFVTYHRLVIYTLFFWLYMGISDLIWKGGLCRSGIDANVFFFTLIYIFVN